MNEVMIRRTQAPPKDFLPCEKPLVDSFTKYNNLKPTSTYQIPPPPDIDLICLLHWKILKNIIFELNTDDRQCILQLQERKTMDGRSGSPPVYNLVPSEPIPVADAHFHLDPSVRCNSGAVPYRLDVEDTQQTFNTTLKFLIANYVYPDSWPSSSDRSEARKDQRIYFTFGLHPRLIIPASLDYLCATFRRLETLLGSTKTVAVGECILDETDRPRHRDLQKQIVYFEKQLHLALRLNLPVVLHSRG